MVDLSRQELDQDLEPANDNNLTVFQSSTVSQSSKDALDAIANTAVKKIAEDCISNGKSVKEGVIDTLAVVTTLNAVNPENEQNKKFNEDITKEKQSEIRSKFKADKYASDAKKAGAKRQKAEEFYKAFRPILEFDFSNITGKERDNNKNYDDRSYGITMMALMLIIFTPFYIMMSLLLMVCKSVNSVCDYVASFGKTAMKICLSTFIVLIILLVVYIIICWVEQRFGVSIIHDVQNALRCLL